MNDCFFELQYYKPKNKRNEKMEINSSIVLYAYNKGFDSVILHTEPTFFRRPL